VPEKEPVTTVQVEAPRVKRAGLGYEEVGGLLRAYFRAELSDEQVCEAVNARLQENEPCPQCEELIRRLSKLQETAKDEVGVRPLRHVVWELRPLRRPSKKGKRVWPRFELNKDGGATDAWRDFAQLLGHGATLRRLKYCAYPPCDQLFFDRTLRGDKTACSTRHKNNVASATRRRKTALISRRERRAKGTTHDLHPA
jgi:hypothetical protein